MTRSSGPGEWNAQPVIDLRGFRLPEPGFLAGYAAVIEHFHLSIPLPPRLAAISVHHRPASTERWRLLAPRYRPPDTLGGHLGFALRYEGVDLSVLAALFKVVSPGDVAVIVRSEPTGGYARRIWFLYEWLRGTRLDVPDAAKVQAVGAVDPRFQVALRDGIISRRHRVVDNLPGTAAFCPMIRRTPRINAFLAEHLDERARAVIGRTRTDVIARAAAYLVLADSKSSFAIENERPSHERTMRWGQAIAQAGDHRLSIAELERLQQVVIGDARFVHIGLRDEGGFVGEHDRTTRTPIPDHISARADDLPGLLNGLIAYDERSEGDVDAVLAAAAVAFGFVYMHPFEDGNGRIHRWLIHHVLARARYNPPGLVFPVSTAIQRDLAEYRRVLESYSRPLLPYIDWRETGKHNVRVLNETADYYRYFDATAHAEFLYRCVQQTVEIDLPGEVRFLEAYDNFSADVQRIVDMPARTVDLLRTFLQQGGGVLSTRARTREFAALTDDEVTRIEHVFADHFRAIPMPAAVVTDADGWR